MIAWISPAFKTFTTRTFLKGKNFLIRLKYLFFKNSLKRKKRNEIFDYIFRKNIWNDSESKSGSGSTLENTVSIRKEIPLILSKYKIKAVVDIPCGDFNWMSKIDFTNLNYIGGDIVSNIINENNKKFSKKNINFVRIDCVNEKLPMGDLLVARDLLVHFSFSDISKFFVNLFDSEIEFILMTSFTHVKKNKDILTGEWRPINFGIAPFYLRSPIEEICEDLLDWPQFKGSKKLLLFKVNDLKKELNFNLFKSK